ncbi:MAG: hypothetical protein IKO35_07000 [Elusimicrobiaceae bacterium]|nr:hypothetical protein [Elusimicrobiaceae bacterium]
MRKIITVFLCFVSSPFVFSYTNNLAQQIKKAVISRTPYNAGAIEKNRTVHFQVLETIYNTRKRAYSGTYLADIFCKAYALDTHWLVTSATCLNIDKRDIWDPGDSTYLERERKHTELKSERGGHFAQGKNLILMWADKEMYAAPFVNLLATDSSNQLCTLSKDHTFQIHTARFGLNKVRVRHLDFGSMQGNKFKLEESAKTLSGTATDPFFVVNKSRNEFLAGYNNGINSYTLFTSLKSVFETSYGLISDTWISLEKEDLDFIKKTVQGNRPQDWTRIKNRLFFNQTQTPYFN